MGACGGKGASGFGNGKAVPRRARLSLASPRPPPRPPPAPPRHPRHPFSHPSLAATKAPVITENTTTECSMSRPLTLHVSALNDAEYTTYTSSIHDITDYTPEHARALDYEKLVVGVREARAWLRGRYPTIAPNTLDTILRLFCPDLAPADVLTGGQFFAALRLVSHVLSGKDVDPTLVFVQGMSLHILHRDRRSPHAMSVGLFSLRIPVLRS
ncbi:hypothetical protein BD414DRAFT_500947 [Trametes punicea]|nr:hypothetical protein BD414DRAFT_500947 [Trametes punicea]